MAFRSLSCIALGLLLAGSPAGAAYDGGTRPDDPVPTLPHPHDGVLKPGVLTAQDDINAGTVDLPTLFYRGMHLYTNRYTTDDGFGEGPTGPRRRKLSLAGGTISPFLRFNGLDAQGCFECHSAMGSTRHGDLSMPRESGSIGSGAGFSANVFIFEEPDDMTRGIVRNPPHNFGLGYIQRLSDEMTSDLLDIADEALREAVATGVPSRKALVSKGVGFGYITASSVGALDRSEVQGVSLDMVVRPFQFKGIASSLRNFIAGAVNFHFAIQPRELLERGFIDDDAQGAYHEMLEGEVSAIAIFLAAMRPPAVDERQLDSASTARGRALMDTVGCTVCHVPSLRIRDPRVTILDPRELAIREQPFRKSAEFVSVFKQVEGEMPPMVPGEFLSENLAPVVQRTHALRKGADERPTGYTFDLNSEDMPDEALPRLPHNADGTIDVPLFSDLRRHRMGAELADIVPQRTEMRSLTVEPDLFVTRPLWGVADTGPWLHDGRATTLREAVVMHAGEGSEANSSVAIFKALSASEQEDLLNFLRCLRVQTKAHPAEPFVPHRTGFHLR